jgi:hypothetical protein
MSQFKRLVRYAVNRWGLRLASLHIRCVAQSVVRSARLLSCRGAEHSGARNNNASLSAFSSPKSKKCRASHDQENQRRDRDGIAVHHPLSAGCSSMRVPTPVHPAVRRRDDLSSPLARDFVFAIIGGRRAAAGKSANGGASSFACHKARNVSCD